MRVHPVQLNHLGKLMFQRQGQKLRGTNTAVRQQLSRPSLHATAAASAAACFLWPRRADLPNLAPGFLNGWKIF